MDIHINMKERRFALQNDVKTTIQEDSKKSPYLYERLGDLAFDAEALDFASCWAFFAWSFSLFFTSTSFLA
jgi:hypothetical protein